MKKQNFISVSVFSLFILFSLTACEWLQKKEVTKAQTPVNPPIIESGDEIVLNPKTTYPADNLNLEAPFRCQTHNLGLDEIISAIPIKKSDLKLSLFSLNDALPRYEVNGYSFENLPVDVAFQRLLLEADISVYDKDGPYIELSGENIRGELKDVLDKLAESADVYWTYDARLKRINLSRRAQFEINVPGNRAVMFALLDAIRGAGIQTVTPVWDENKLVMTLSRDTQKVVQKLLNHLKEDPQLMVFDIKVFKAYPQEGQEIDWQNVIERFGLKKIDMSLSSIMGRMVVSSYENNFDIVPRLVAQNASIALASQGFVVAPTGWKVRFDVGRCGRMMSKDSELSVLINPIIKPDKRIETDFVLDSLSGEITSFKTVSTVGDNFMIIGLPTNVFNKQETGSEYVITITSRIIRLVEGK